MRVGRRVSAAVTMGMIVVCVALLLSATRSGAVSARQAAARGPVLTFYFGLTRPESRAVAAFWAVQQPGSATYRRFLTPAEIARRYGASTATRRAFIVAMRRIGLTASIDPSGVFARVNGTKSQLERAFHVKITGTFDDLSTSYATNRPLRLPAAVKPLVREVITNFVRTTVPSGSA